MAVAFSYYLQDFIHYLRFEKRYSNHTINAYSTDLEQYQQYHQSTYPDIGLENIDHQHLRGWMAQLKENNLNSKSINRKISSISNYFNFLIRKAICTKNPTRIIHALKTAKDLPVFLKISETEQLLENVDFGETFEGKTQQLILELLYSCGLRRSELIQLKEMDIEWGLGQLRVLGKGNKERLIPLGAALLYKIRDYLDEKQQLGIHTTSLLSRGEGKKIYDRYVYNTVKTHLSKVCSLKKKSPHVLRHTFATHLLNEGANIQAIKDLLGHASIAATQIYTHINIDKLKKVHKLNHPRG